MGDNETTVSLENKFEELHNNVRHITQLAMNWFAFFVTVNYVTMGWFAKSSANESTNPHIVPIVAGVFIVQNVLGVFGIAGVLLSAKTMTKQVNDLEKPHSDKSIPMWLYYFIGGFLIIVLGSLIYAWASIICQNSK